MKNGALRYLPFYLINLGIMAAMTCAVSQIFTLFPDREEGTGMIGLAVAVIFCLLAILSHCLAKGNSLGYLLSYTLNAMGSGCCVGTVFADYAMEPLVHLLLIALIPGAVLGILLLLGSTVQNETFLKIWYISFFVLAVIQFICGICLWILWEPVVGCFILFTALYLMPLPIDCLGQDVKKYRYLSFSGFGAFILILFVAVLLLTEGEILDGLDFDFGSGKSKKNR